MRTETPVQIKLADYQPYPFAIDDVLLRFELEPSATKVHAKMTVRRLSAGPLVLDGVDLKLDEVRVDGTALEASSYELSDEALTLTETPDSFTLETIVTIDPSANTALSGLYISGGRFCTQCESVGFRRITYWPDRPDVMSRFKCVWRRTKPATRSSCPMAHQARTAISKTGAILPNGTTRISNHLICSPYVAVTTIFTAIRSPP
jgi:aminopeptidase N